MRNGRFCCFCGVPLISALRQIKKIQGATEMASGKGANIAKWTILLLLWGSPQIGNPRRPEIKKIQRDHGNGFRERSEHCEMDDFAAFVSSSHFGNPRRPEIQKIQGALEMASEKERTLRNERFCCFCGVPLHFGSFRRRKSRKSTGALEMASGKRANIAKWTILLLLWGSLRFGPSAALNQENPRRPGNGFQHCEMDDFAAFVRFPSFRQLSAAGTPENQRGPGNGFRERSEHLRNGRFCCFCGVPLISAAFGGRKSRKSKGPWKLLPEKERTLRNGRFCCFCGVPLISAAFGGGNPENSRGPGNGHRKRERTLGNGRFCCFCGFPPHFGSLRRREIQKIQTSGKGARFCCFCGVPFVSALRWPEIKKNQGALEMASGKGANIAKWTILLLLRGSASFRQLSEAGKSKGPWKWLPGKERTLRNGRCCCFCGVPSFRHLCGRKKPENPRGPGNGFRKRSEHCEIDVFAVFVGFPSFRQHSAAEIQKIQTSGKGARFCCFCGVPFVSALRRRKSRKFKRPWKWPPEKERTLGNGRCCCFLWGSPHFGSLRRRKSRKSKLPEKERTLRNGRFCCFCGVPLILAAFGSGTPENPRGLGNGFQERSEHCGMDDCAAFVGFLFISAAFGGRKSRKSKGPWKWLPGKERTLRNGRCCCFCGVPSFRPLGGRTARKSKGPWKWLPRKFGV